MFEAKLTIHIEASALVQAINNLAAALCGTKPQADSVQSDMSAPMPQQVIDAANAATSAQTQMPQQAAYAPLPTAQPLIQDIQAPAPMPSAIPVAQPSVQSPQQAAPALNAGIPLAQPPQYTVDQIMAAGATLMDSGRVNELIALLQSFGVQAVTDLKPEQIGPFATALRNMGAKI